VEIWRTITPRINNRFDSGKNHVGRPTNMGTAEMKVINKLSTTGEGEEGDPGDPATEELFSLDILGLNRGVWQVLFEFSEGRFTGTEGGSSDLEILQSLQMKQRGNSGFSNLS
jgi:hypothetical protein